MTDKKLPVTELLPMAASEIGAVGKDAQMSGGGARYNYRSLDDLVDAVSPALAKYGITFTPNGITVIDKLEKQTRSGGTQYHLRAVITYVIYGPQGDSITASVLAEGTDTGDKAGNKLMSGAYKYVLAQVLCIPYAGVEDQDAYIAEPTLPEIPEGGALLSIEASAKALGKSVEEVTAKYREQHGGIGVDELPMTTEADLMAFAKQLAAYTAQQTKK